MYQHRRIPLQRLEASVNDLDSKRSDKNSKRKRWICAFNLEWVDRGGFCTTHDYPQSSDLNQYYQENEFANGTILVVLQDSVGVVLIVVVEARRGSAASRTSRSTSAASASSVRPRGSGRKRSRRPHAQTRQLPPCTQNQAHPQETADSHIHQGVRSVKNNRHNLVERTAVMQCSKSDKSILTRTHRPPPIDIPVKCHRLTIHLPMLYCKWHVHWWWSVAAGKDAFVALRPLHDSGSHNEAVSVAFLTLLTPRRI
ncbi:hypothetical protein EVAR_8819_1 [Eumeta japonica]|uniref:Uncharacterized protein n=1 Tax=Eumeta variegata TaxID=151549 RepID=A0A4C1TTX4_EUMVA|nr:hypothetical protein EVAR_8819_1 [Eumeta japonica]